MVLALCFLLQAALGQGFGGDYSGDGGYSLVLIQQGPVVSGTLADGGGGALQVEGTVAPSRFLRDTLRRPRSSCRCPT